MELWKNILGDENFEVSNLGRVKYKSKLIKPRYNKLTGFRYIFLSGGKWEYVHNLVAEAFVPNPEKKSFVVHKNGRKLDNRANNLKWKTPKI